MKNKVFYFGIGMLFSHELDAMSNREWLILPLTSWLPEQYGELVFVFLHIPLFAILVALIASPNPKVRIRTMCWLSISMAVHGLSHGLFMMFNDKYEFHSVLSNFLIFGGALCGIIYLLLDRFEHQ